MEIITETPEQTLRLGISIGERSAPGDIFFLSGELGGGKTVFAKGVAIALGISPNRVISPSFTIVLEHHGGRCPFYHLDFYRLCRIEELNDLGLEMYFSGEGIVVIEWADRMAGALPEGSLSVSFHWVDEKRRRIHLKPETQKWQDIVASLQRDWPK